MKIFKKICLGVGLMALLATFLQLALGGKALAAAPDFNLQYVSSSNEITGSYKNNSFAFLLASPGASSKWTFIVASGGGPICANSQITNIDPNNLGKQDVTGTAASFKYMANGAPCTSSSQSTTYNGILLINASSNGGSGTGGSSGSSTNSQPIDWKGAKGVVDDTGAHMTVSFGDGTVMNLTNNNPGSSPANFKPADPGKYGGVVVASWCSNTILPQSTNGDVSYGINLASYSASTGMVKVCYTSDNAKNPITQSNISIPVDTSAYTSSASSTSTSCEANFNSPFGWIICPAFHLADDSVSSFGEFIDDQLCFKTTESTASSSTGSSVRCSGNNNLDTQVHNAWSIFKNIASALLVVVILIMVISQAIGGGPFDAYTIRKVLPRLVAAVILIQISWVLLKFAIDLSNDFGKAVGDLMMAPFGGSDNLKLEVLMGKAFSTHSGWTNSALALSFYAIAGVAALAASIPGIAMLALYVVLAVLTAFIVLIFRKLLLIMLVILAPIAFVLWLLPGTDRYWKMWRENFTKLLLMYPMIMGLIAAGRIFASITAGNTAVMEIHLGVAHLGRLPVPYFASATDFVELAIIVGAYFAPYFLLPQTFKWGGTALGSISKGVPQALEKMGGKQAKEYLNWRQGLTPWKQSRAIRRAETERRVHHQYYENLTDDSPRGRLNRARLYGVSSREANRAIVRRATQHAEAELDKARKEEIQQATVELTQHFLPQYDQASQDDIREAIATGKTLHVQRADGSWEDFDGAEYARNHHFGQRAALDRALIHGQMGVIDQYYTEAMNSGDQARVTEATTFKDENAEVLGRRLTHVLKGYGVAVAATAGEISQMSGHEVESIIAEFTSRIERGRAPGATPQEIAAASEAATNLRGFLQRHRDARANTSTAGSVDLRGTAAVEAYLGALRGDPAAVAQIDRINHGSPDPVTGTLIDSRGRRVDREANRDRYRSPGVPLDQTIPEIRL